MGNKPAWAKSLPCSRSVVRPDDPVLLLPVVLTYTLAGGYPGDEAHKDPIGGPNGQPRLQPRPVSPQDRAGGPRHDGDRGSYTH